KKGHDKKKKGDHVQIGREERADDQTPPTPAINNGRLARRSQRPSTLDERARHPPGKETSHVGRDEGNPHRDEPALQFNALRNQVNREPLRNKEEDWVGKRPGDDRSPGLRKPQEIAPPGPSL